MEYFMHYLYASDVQESVDFYLGIGFNVHSDDLDGCAVRHARLSHPECGNTLIALENFPELITISEQNISPEKHPLRVALTIVSDDYFLWRQKFQKKLVTPVLSIIEPYGTWIYYHDPAKNLICISNTSLW